MQTITHSQVIPRVSRTTAGSGAALWTGRTLSGIAVLFLIFDSAGKLLQVEPVVEGTAALGYPVSIIFDSAGKLLQLEPVVAGTVALGYPVTAIFGLGVTLSLCVAAYLVPPTSVLGALLLTGYLGGAVATHVRVGTRCSRTYSFPSTSRRCCGAGCCCARRACEWWCPATARAPEAKRRQ